MLHFHQLWISLSTHVEHANTPVVLCNTPTPPQTEDGVLEKHPILNSEDKEWVLNPTSR